MANTVDYTSRDYASVRQALIDRIKLRFPNDWPEFTKTSIAMAILDIVAWTHEQRAFYYDVQARNCFLETADLPEAVTAIARSLGYKRRMASSASVAVTLYPNTPQPAPITIARGQALKVDGVTFEAAEDYIIPAGQSAWPTDSSDELIVFTEGASKYEEFTSNGEAYQIFQLSHPNVIQGSVDVEILGEYWEETSSLVFIEGMGIKRDSFVGDGLANQSYQLSLLNVIIDPDDEDTLTVMISSERWLHVEEFTGAPQEFRVEQTAGGETTVYFGAIPDGAAPALNAAIDIIYQVSSKQRRYTVEYDTAGKATVNFGDGVSGVIPDSGTVITVRYRVGGGVRGNIRRGLLDGNVRGTLPSGAQLNVRVYNHEPGSGGEDIETLSRVKTQAPVYAISNRRAVTKQDFAALAMTYSDPTFGAAAFASAKLKQRVPEINAVQVALWSRDSVGRISTAASPLKQAVKAFLDAYRGICTYIEITDGDILYFEIEANVLLLSGKTIASVQSEVNTTLQDYFNSTFVAPGIDLSLALIVKEMLELSSIENVVLENVVGSRLVTQELGTGTGSQNQYLVYLEIPDGQAIVPGSVLVTAGTQSVSDDESGNLLGNIDSGGNNTVDYTTGAIDVTFESAPGTADYITAEARYYARMDQTETVTADTANAVDGITDFAPIVRRRYHGLADGQIVDTFLPEIYLPYTPHRITLIGGWDQYGTQTGGQLMAFDDGDGGITGDVLAGGVVNYETGQINFTWNTLPPPSGYTTYWGYLSALPDGSTTEFTYEVRTAAGGGGSQVSLESLEGIGRLKYDLADLDTVNVTYYPAFDDGDGILDSESLHTHKTNAVIYQATSGFAEGTLNFRVPPEAASGRDFRIYIGPSCLFLYASFSLYIQNTTGSGYYKKLVADKTGRFLRDVGVPYPYARLDHQTGRFLATLNAPSAAEMTMQMSYDSFVSSNNKDIPIETLTLPTFSRVTLNEIQREVNV